MPQFAPEFLQPYLHSFNEKMSEIKNSKDVDIYVFLLLFDIMILGIVLFFVFGSVYGKILTSAAVIYALFYAFFRTKEISDKEE